MFDRCATPRIFGLPPGADFPAALVQTLLARHAGRPPEALARVRIIVNTRRMARRIRDLFDAGVPCLLPRVTVISDLGTDMDAPHLPPAVSPLRRRLELAQLVSALLQRQPDLAPRSALYDLADSLAMLLDEMQGEDVPPEAIAALDVSDQSGHWARIQTFLGIIRPYFDPDHDAPDSEARQRRVVAHLCRIWQTDPPETPVIIAGSTGSRGTTQMLMQTVAQMPQGAVLLPGFDFDMPAPVWAALGDAFSAEDHPQYRFAAVLDRLGMTPADVRRWPAGEAPCPARNKIMSLALRPAPVTDQWLRDGPGLCDVGDAMAQVSLIEAPSRRLEAMAIALRLRQAAEDGQSAALITPDRSLTRQVAAALDRWAIRPDDSAGTPLHHTPPGRFLRQVADLCIKRLSAEALLALLKHPLAHSGQDRGAHLHLTRALDLHLRRHGPPYPAAADLGRWADTQDGAFAADWGGWLAACVAGRFDQGAEAPLDTRVAAHLDLAENLAQGCRGTASGALWDHEAGQQARRAMDALLAEAKAGGAMTALDYSHLLRRVLARETARSATAVHPHIRIWGTLEARVQGADLLILAGLNEGSWPEAPPPDPWLNRALRHRAGLLLPERRIGLSAHDFQQAIGAREVWMTRAIRSDDAQTVASRWLNRLQNLLAGLPGQGGAAALTDMRRRGALWLGRVAQLEAPGPGTPAPRAAPCPPAALRPTRLSVTEIRTLIRDPYAIYARHVLRLRPLDPLMKTPDALLRGTVLHDVLEQFIRATMEDPQTLTRATLMQMAQTVLAENVPWAEARALWLARLDRVAGWFVDTETERRQLARPAHLELRAEAALTDPPFTLTAKADRIDVDAAGHLHIYDYKTGAPPSKAAQQHFDKQLLLEAAMAEQGAFAEIGPAQVARAVYIGLSGSGTQVPAPLDDEPAAQVWARLRDLIGAYARADTGYVARRAMHSTRDRGDYDQLARFGEWEITDAPVPERFD